MLMHPWTHQTLDYSCASPSSRPPLTALHLRLQRHLPRQLARLRHDHAGNFILLSLAALAAETYTRFTTTTTTITIRRLSFSSIATGTNLQILHHNSDFDCLAALPFYPSFTFSIYSLIRTHDRGLVDRLIRVGLMLFRRCLIAF